MSRFPEKIIEHLRFARNWLDRAEEEYSQDKIIQAELTLSLAEAEVRHAWETSRGLVPSTLRKIRLWRRRAMALTVAVLVVWAGYYLWSHQQPSYPTPAFNLGGAIMPGSWESQVEYKLVVVEAPRPAPVRPETLEPERLEPEVSQIVIPEPAPIKPPLPETEEEVISVAPKISQVPVANNDSQEEAVKTEETTAPLANVKEDIGTKEDEPTPPQIDLGALFKLANDALKGEGINP